MLGFKTTVAAYTLGGSAKAIYVLLRARQSNHTLSAWFYSRKNKYAGSENQHSLTYQHFIKYL